MEAQRPVVLKPYGNIDWELKTFGHLAEIRLIQCETEEDFVGAIRDVDILSANVDVKVTARVIESANRLRAILCTSMGTDFVDMQAANKKGIWIANLPDFAVEAVSEHAVLLMLMVARKMAQLFRCPQTEQWPSRRLFKGFEVGGKTLGIIGLGKTGQSVAKKAAGLGMSVIAFSPHADPEEAKSLGVQLVGLEELLGAAHVVTVHTTLRPESYHLIGMEQLQMMQPTAILINVARGPIVDEEALIEALSKGRIAGAGLDVLEAEPPDPDNRLWKMDNVVITPHMAWNTVEAKSRSEATLREEYIRLIKGEEPRNFVNRKALKQLAE